MEHNFKTNEKEKQFLNLSRIDLSPNYIEEFIIFYSEKLDNKSQEITHQEQQIYQDKKENIYVEIAKPDDAKNIIQIINDSFVKFRFYEMLDVEYVENLIRSKNNEVFIFKNQQNEIMGTITFIIDFELKKGYIRSFAILKKYWEKSDITNATTAIYLYIYKKYKDRIFLWISETLNNSSQSQYLFKHCNVEPLGFFPNKDKFEKLEGISEFLQVAYNKKAITQFRSKEIPKIIIEVMKPFIYSSIKYNLNEIEVIEPNLRLENNIVLELEKNIIKTQQKDKFGHINVKLSINDSNSYLSYVYTSELRNVDDIQYKVSRLEELHAFLQKLYSFIKEYNIRYCEGYVSAYQPTHQRIFTKFGFKPRGYIPSLKYNKESGVFEDYILFNIFFHEIKKELPLEEDIELVLKHFIEGYPDNQDNKLKLIKKHDNDNNKIKRIKDNLNPDTIDEYIKRLPPIKITDKYKKKILNKKNRIIIQTLISAGDHYLKSKNYPLAQKYYSQSLLLNQETIKIIDKNIRLYFPIKDTKLINNFIDSVKIKSELLGL